MLSSLIQVLIQRYSRKGMGIALKVNSLTGNENLVNNVRKAKCQSFCVMKMWPLPLSVCGLVVPRKEIQELLEPLFEFLSYCCKSFLTVNIHLCTNHFICPLFTPFSCENQTREKGRLFKLN